ncbi:hypothetical protein BD410DRAFT_748353 [Rickenella mellea]|uniref:BTB domain-containing protein n=1 Tax=Rickenella mellea TaxID=50990 RepID=A0A4Y7Q4M2_9AGAM|nr:hypothetical protein BD410DRAFT_748353 [Rickenella mellea]
MRTAAPMATKEALQDSAQLSYHERFALPDADIILRSKDDVYFRVPSITLHMTCAFFRDALSLPQPASSASSGGVTNNNSPGVIPIDESALVAEQFLSIICGLGISPALLATFDDASALLHAAEKYEAPGVTAFVRACMGAPRFLAEPLRLFAVACRYSWEEEAAAALRLTLDIDIGKSPSFPVLATLPGPDLLRLLRVRWARRDALKAALDGPAFTANQDPYRCSTCQGMVDVVSWREWKWIMLDEIARVPSGETLLAESFLTSAKANAVFRPHCKAPGCENTAFNRELTIVRIREAVRALPKDIE